MNVLGGVIQPDSRAMTFDGQPYAPAAPADATAAGRTELARILFGAVLLDSLRTEQLRRLRSR